jgi:conjugative relaxase-like TrwC/TraI family protein
VQSISKPKKGGAGGGYYFKYYSDHSDERGQWFGRGAKILGLSDAVQKKQINCLLEGFSPKDSIPLVQNAGSSKRQGFWDITLSAPKPVSVLYMTAPDWVRKEIESSMRSAMEFTLSYIEDVAGFSRRGEGGKIVERAALSFATFFHTSSRAEDPQLHFHCLLLNVGVRSDGSTGSLHTREVFREKMNSGALFQVRLAYELGQRLAVEIEPQKVGFQIKGIPKELCEDCSKRRKEIEGELRKRGVTDAISAKEAALKTRGKKGHTERASLDAWWKTIAAGRKWGTEDVESLVNTVR